jgi:hypothetical protein
LLPVNLIAVTIAHVVAVAVAIVIALIAIARPSPGEFMVSQPVSQHVAI